ncbi:MULTISPECIES: aspartyl-phosphate phosphatase Spo0E family protein [unclassified Candidatus Frackibacter]|uniref:aspartyl-phosphate phosphatase Spo0E family protein n=1 Tax=unclassified Candidatus Frackibacter TaxID=2648818 RepID=UPI0007954B2D|nr:MULTISPECIES: aspartyl-phosphate phosphatase Spo0E family protein [unclassified Candidatus Frackibacter]KXS42360.1 MAG: hypothetical protein AWU54_1359 [Candidatus Frackibacter sp. T328-2]SDC68643.1 Spo0E like sporulation regulatory protein [Candidatus Frackibacter sp. WG11]SEM83049.1 Spo0E like sporulation regulatory protein [Candidatus Frackibacter sp. WG12]SFL92239.1 Spo0E like sporulation regulatory protein [Candidatus Frackibacter sp. WG13]
MCSIIHLEDRIIKLKLELIKLAEEKNKINNAKVLKKSQELDELIVLYMEKKKLIG